MTTTNNEAESVYAHAHVPADNKHIEVQLLLDTLLNATMNSFL